MGKNEGELGKDEFNWGEINRMLRLAMEGAAPATEGVSVPAETSPPPLTIRDLQQSCDDAKAAFDLYLKMGGLQRTPGYYDLYDRLQVAQYRLNDLKERESKKMRLSWEAPYREDLKRILGHEPTDDEVKAYIDDPKTPKYRQGDVKLRGVSI